MRVLVTGHHGYIGSIVGPMLHEAGHDVVGLDTFFYRDCDFGEVEFPFEERQADIRDVTAAELEGFDAVVHLAALSNDPLGDLDEDLTYDINLRGTLHLAEAAKEAGVERFVFASSCSMYGAASGDDLLDERAPLRPLTPYAESKVQAEAGLSRLADDTFSPVSLRNATAYGVSARLRLDVVLNNLAGLGVHDRQDPAALRRQRLAADRPRPRTSAGRRSALSTRRASWCTTSRSTSAPMPRTTASASWPSSSTKSSRNARSRSPARRTPIRGATASTSAASSSSFPTTRPRGQRARARRSWSRPTARSASRPRSSRATATPA